MSAYDDLLEERYGRSLWWKKPERTPVEETAAWQRGLLLRAAEVADEDVVLPIERGRVA
jgi:hypothetical protein